jgi:hypothetical protein
MNNIFCLLRNVFNVAYMIGFEVIDLNLFEPVLICPRSFKRFPDYHFHTSTFSTH